MESQYHESSLFSNVSPKPISVVPPVRVIKKRNTANKKERRRTQSINNAFSCLREKIPNVPSDTKLSKVSFKSFTKIQQKAKKLNRKFTVNKQELAFSWSKT